MTPDLAPAPRSLLALYLQQLEDLGLPGRAVSEQLAWLRLFQLAIAPRRLMAIDPTAADGALTALAERAGLTPAQRRAGLAALATFYAFAAEAQPDWPLASAWERFPTRPLAPGPMRRSWARTLAAWRKAMPARAEVRWPEAAP